MSTILFREINQLMTLENAEALSGRGRLGLDGLSLISKGAILCQRGQIIKVGAEGDVLRFVREQQMKPREIFLKNQNVYPAFIECHTHLVFGGSRAEEFNERLEGLSYEELNRRGRGILSTVEATRALAPSQLLKLAEGRLQRFIEQGVTCLEAKSGYGLSLTAEAKLIQVAKKLEALAPIEIVPCYLGPHSIPKEYASRPADYLNEVCLPALQKMKALGVKRVDIFYEKGFFEKDLAERYCREAISLGLDVAVHADQLNSTGASLDAVRWGARSIEHAIKISPEAIHALANSQTTAVLLPSADFYMRCDYPPARAMIDAGARVAIATDFNPGSSPSPSISFAGLLARTEMKMSLAEVWRAYTLNAAYALGVEESRGSFTQGKRADFVVSDADVSEFFYDVQSQPVLEVWSNAKKIFKKR